MPVSGLIKRLVKGTPLTSAEGDKNLTIIEDFLNALEQLFGVVLKPNGTLKDGAVGASTVLADGVVTAAKLAADAKLPAGTVIDFAGTAVPAGYLECDGSPVSRTTYSALFAAIGITWGPGDGSTTFNVPDLRRRVCAGSGGSGSSDLGNAVGNTGGEEKHTLTGPESGVAAHSHKAATGTVRWEGGGVTGGIGGSSMTITGGFDDQAATPASAAEAHNTIQPTAIMKKCIKT